MKICEYIKINGIEYPHYRDMTPKEEIEYNKSLPQDTRSYEQKVVDEIRKRYSIDDELAILRQRDTKPEEFNEYNEFVESVKRTIKGE